MYKLTKRRQEAAEAILERYNKQLEARGQIDSGLFEKELRDCWNLGYQELKDITIDLSKKERYERLAAYYMQNSNPLGPVSEFVPRLKELYGASGVKFNEGKASYWSENEPAYSPPDPIALTEAESKLYSKIGIGGSREVDWSQSAHAMESLMCSLLDRDAIPEIRMRVFADVNRS